MTRPAGKKLYDHHVIKVVPANHTGPEPVFYAIAESELLEVGLLPTIDSISSPDRGEDENSGSDRSDDSENTDPPNESTNELIEVIPYEYEKGIRPTYIVAKSELVPVNEDGCVPDLRWAVVNDERQAYYAVSVMKERVLNKADKGTGLTPLHLITKFGTRNLFKAVLRRMSKRGIQAPVERNHAFEFYKGDTVLHQIVKHDRADLLRLLVRLWPYPVRQLANREAGRIPLSIAVTNNNKEIIDILLRYTQLTSIARSYGSFGTILDDALLRGNNEMAHLILANDYLRETIAKRGPRLLRSASRSNYKIFKLVYSAYITAGHSPTETTCYGTTFFSLMIQHRNSKCAIKLMSNPDFDARLLTMPDRYGSTPLHWAASQGLHKVCKRLYPTYESADLLLVQGRLGHSILAAACEGYGCYYGQPSHINYKAVIDMFLSDPTVGQTLINTCDKDGWTPLYLAVSHGASDQICETLYAKSDSSLICKQFSDGYTVLHLAVTNKRLGLIDILLKDPTKSRDLPPICNAKGKTALQLSDNKYLPGVREHLVLALEAL